MAEDQKTQAELDAEAAASGTKPPAAKPQTQKASAPPVQAKAASAGENVKGKMLKAIGAKADDVLSYNAEARVMVTQQGGKYRLSADGKKLTHLAGPAPTGGKKAAGDEDDEG